MGSSNIKEGYSATEVGSGLVTASVVDILIGLFSPIIFTVAYWSLPYINT